MNLIDIHKFSIFNEESIKKSNICGCFYCKKIFKPNEIKYFTTDIQGKNRTAWCPYCDIDSVLGDADVEITEDLLLDMNVEFFGKSKENKCY